jgi:hypothetical protein
MAISDGVRLVMAVNVRIIRPHDETLYLIGDEMENGGRSRRRCGFVRLSAWCGLEGRPSASSVRPPTHHDEKRVILFLVPQSTRARGRILIAAAAAPIASEFTRTDGGV